MSLEEILKKRVAELDALHLSPEERASQVNTLFFHALGLESTKEFVEHPLYWDLICFCNEMLIFFLAQSLGPNDRTFKHAISVSNFVYSVHYSAKEEVTPMLGPDREEHLKIWQERFEFLIKDGE